MGAPAAALPASVDHVGRELVIAPEPALPADLVDVDVGRGPAAATWPGRPVELGDGREEGAAPVVTLVAGADAGRGATWPAVAVAPALGELGW